MAKQVSSYSHPASAGDQEPDTKPGDYYVSIIDPSSNAGHGRTSLALGPFTNDHAGALAQVETVRGYVNEHYPRSAWWSFGTARLVSGKNPRGVLNDVLAEALS